MDVAAELTIHTGSDDVIARGRQAKVAQFGVGAIGGGVIDDDDFLVDGYGANAPQDVGDCMALIEHGHHDAELHGGVVAWRGVQCLHSL